MPTTTGKAGAIPYVTEQFDKRLNEALVKVGEEFGLYSVLASIGPATTEQVAGCTGISLPQLDHWLTDQATAGYLDHDRSTGRFSIWCDIGRN